jgi:hypothetical protein
MVTTLWHLDNDRIINTFGPVVRVQSTSKAVGFYADEGIQVGIERGGPPENLDPDDIFLETIAAAGERLFDQKSEEAVELS